MDSLTAKQVQNLNFEHNHNTHTQPFNSPLSGTNRVGQYQKKHSPNYTHPDNQRSFINFLHLLRSTASSLFNVRIWQSFPQPLSRSSWSGILYFILNAFLHPVVIFFSQQMPIPLQTVFTVIPMLCHLFLISLSAPYLKICLLVNATHPSDYSHLCSLKCHLIFFPYRPNITIITK